MDTTLQERFSEKGLKDLQTRLKTLVTLFNENNRWKEDLVVLGFGKLNIEDREECFGRVRELSEILGVQVKLMKITKDGKEDYELEVGL